MGLFGTLTLNSLVHGWRCLCRLYFVGYWGAVGGRGCFNSDVWGLGSGEDLVGFCYLDCLSEFHSDNDFGLIGESPWPRQCFCEHGPSLTTRWITMPLQFPKGTDRNSIKLTGIETISIEGLCGDIQHGQTLTMTVACPYGSRSRVVSCYRALTLRM